MTWLVTSIEPTHLADLQACAARAWERGCDAVELRIDLLEDPLSAVAEHLKKNSDRHWIVTCRSAREGGNFAGSESQCLQRLHTATAGTTAIIDLEFAYHSSKDSTKEPARPTTILSAHQTDAPFTDLAKQFDRMRAGNRSAVVKIAYQAKHIDQSFAALDLLYKQRHQSPGSIVIAMGESGLWTRVLAKKLSAFASFCGLDHSSITAPGQLSLDEMINRYRWRSINEDTHLYGVVGNPVAHSMSPFLFNRWFEQASINAVYLPLKVDGPTDPFVSFMEGCRHRPWLDLRGLSVTVPHKTAALRWLADRADDEAKRIGAANTLVFDEDGVQGFNTDVSAGVSSLVEALGCTTSDLTGLPVAILGAGGVARAMVGGLAELGCQTTIHARSIQQAQKLAVEFSAEAAPWEDRVNRATQSTEVLINCTPLGMWPSIDETPMPATALEGYRLVFDLIYHPIETKLLRDARKAGSIALGGLDMFVRQAAKQFELWTKQTPDCTRAMQRIGAELQHRTTDHHASPS